MPGAPDGYFPVNSFGVQARNRSGGKPRMPAALLIARRLNLTALYGNRVNSHPISTVASRLKPAYRGESRDFNPAR